jgi:hypothetical protein
MMAYELVATEWYTGSPSLAVGLSAQRTWVGLTSRLEERALLDKPAVARGALQGPHRTRSMAKTRKETIQAAEGIGNRPDHPISLPEFTRLTGISRDNIRKEFPNGGWTELKRFVGFAPCATHPGHITEEELLQEFHRVVCEANGIPTRTSLRYAARFNIGTHIKRFGGFDGILSHYREWLIAHGNGVFLHDVGATSPYSQ